MKAYWFKPNRVDEAIDALQDLGYVVDIKKLRGFADTFKESELIVYRLKTGLSHSFSNLDSCKKSNPHSTYIDLLGHNIDLLEPKVLILTDEYKDAQNSFAELCSPVKFIYDDSVPF